MQYRIISRDFPTEWEPASRPEIETALSFYDRAVSDADALITQARASYRRVWLSRLQVWRQQLIHERGIWRDALSRSLAQPRPASIDSLWSRSQTRRTGRAN